MSLRLMKTTRFLLLWACIAVACEAPEEAETVAAGAVEAEPLVFEEIDVPAAPGSGLPNFHTTPSGAVLLSWVEPGTAQAFALRFARHDSDGWTPPQTIAEGDDWFVNWADFPSVVALSDSVLAAHLLVKSGPATYAYDVQITRSLEDRP